MPRDKEDLDLCDEDIQLIVKSDLTLVGPHSYADQHVNAAADHLEMTSMF